MSRSWRGLSAMPAVVSVAAAQVPVQPPATMTPPPLASAGAPLVLRGVTVIDVRDGERRSDQTVVIAGRRIQSVEATAAARIPKGARVVEARGKYLIPGLWDMHVHPHQYVDVAFPLFVANGITGVRDAGSEVPLATLAQWKQEIAAGRRIGPRLLVSGPAIDEAKAGQTGIRSDTNPAAPQFLYVPPALVKAVVDSLHDAGADFIKMYNMSRAMRLALAAEARRVGIPFGGHSGSVSGLEMSDSGATFLDHQTWSEPDICGESGGRNAEVDLAACTAAADRFRRNHTWVTVLAQSGIAMSAEAAARFKDRLRRYVPASFPGWHLVTGSDTQATTPPPTGLVALHEAKMPILVGTDAILAPIPSRSFLAFAYIFTPGFILHDALQGLVRAGFTPLEALQAATLNPAEVLHATDSLGTVEAGKVADLVLLDADPLADIRHSTAIRAVVADGRYYDRAALDQLLAEAEQAAAHR